MLDFIKTIFALVIFAVGMIAVIGVFLYTFGLLRVSLDQQGRRYIITNFGGDGGDLKCYFDIPPNDTPRCDIVTEKR